MGPQQRAIGAACCSPTCPAPLSATLTPEDLRAMNTRRSVRLVLLTFAAVLGTTCTVNAAELPSVESYGDRVVVKKEIAFSKEGQEHQKLDLYLPKGEGPFPVVVCWFGGGLHPAKAGMARTCLPGRQGHRGRSAGLLPGPAQGGQAGLASERPGCEMRGALPARQRQDLPVLMASASPVLVIAPGLTWR